MNNSILCGVCSAIANALNISPVFIRLAFICLLFASPQVAIALYIILAVIL